MEFKLDQLLDDLHTRTAALIEQRAVADPLLVGIHTGGCWIAQKLHKQLGISTELGVLDISFYRDDFSQIGLNPQVKPSQLPLDISGKHIILIDDVLHTGRTVRAALNELFDYSRPASVTLVVLIDRGGRELPVTADVVGMRLDLQPHQQVKLGGPEPLGLKVIELDPS